MFFGIVIYLIIGGALLRSIIVPAISKIEKENGGTDKSIIRITGFLFAIILSPLWPIFLGFVLSKAFRIAFTKKSVCSNAHKGSSEAL